MPNLKKELLIVSKYKSGGGFTLVEMLVAIFVFIIVLGASSAIFVDIIRNQKRALANQELLNQTSYVLEYMGRAIRMAKKDDINGPNCCPLGYKVNYELTHGDQGIIFRNYEDKCQEFFWDVNDHTLKEVKGGVGPISLTSTSSDVVSFKIGPPDSWVQTDNNQPRVTLFLDIKRLGFPSGEKPEVKIQTTISQRNLDVQY